MSDERPTPWWYSGGEERSTPGGDEEPADAGDGDSSRGLGDWTALLSGAARVVDWATSTVMAPHADHTDPHEHPQCVVCRTITLVGDPGGLMGSGGSGGGSAADAPATGTATDAPLPAPAIQWIPIADDPTR